MILMLNIRAQKKQDNFTIRNGTFKEDLKINLKIITNIIEDTRFKKLIRKMDVIKLAFIKRI
jgi:hypothetical protein